MKSYPISVNLVVYNGARWLTFCLEALWRNTRQDFFLMIIDNGSLDNSVLIIEEFLELHPSLNNRTRLVKNKKNLGFARAHNQALAWTASDYVLLLNQDVLLDKLYLEICADFLSKHVKVGSVGGKVLSWNFRPDSFTFDDLNNLQKVSRIDSLGLVIKRNREVRNIAAGLFDQGQYNEIRQVFGISGTAPLYRRQALEAVSVNGEIFDSDFISYKEDVDLAWRLALGGFSAWYLPQAVAYHSRSLSTERKIFALIKKRQNWPRELRVYSWVNHIGVLLKNDGFINFLKDSPWILFYEFKKLIYLLFFEPLTLLQGLSRLFEITPVFIRKRKLLRPKHKISPPALRVWFNNSFGKRITKEVE